MKKLFLFAIIFCLTLFSANAQNFQEGFFLESDRTAFRYNPAAAGGQGFIGVGNFMSTKAANIGASSFLFPDPKSPEAVSGLSSKVPAETFLSGLKDLNCKAGEINYNLFSYGFAKNGAFHTVEANVKNAFNGIAAKDFFSLLKSGVDAGSYDIAGSQVSDRAYAELAYGYSRKLSDIVSVGARAKLLVGFASASYEMKKMDIFVDQEELYISGEAQLNITSRSHEMKGKEGETFRLRDYEKKKGSKIPSGLGLAMDLGVVVTPDEYWTVSASLLDLGGAFWRYGITATSSGTFSYDEFINTLDFSDLSVNSILQAIAELQENLADVVLLKKGPVRHIFSPVPMKANLGVKYKMPFYDALSVGVVGNFTGFKGMPYLESRFGIGLAPWDWISVTGNVGYSSFGAVWGAGANARVDRFRVCLGMENYFGGKVPLKGKTIGPCKKTFSIGMTFDL